VVQVPPPPPALLLEQPLRSRRGLLSFA
jgi:hypothetical protein